MIVAVEMDVVAREPMAEFDDKPDGSVLHSNARRAMRRRCNRTTNCDREGIRDERQGGEE